MLFDHEEHDADDDEESISSNGENKSAAVQDDYIPQKLLVKGNGDNEEEENVEEAAERLSISRQRNRDHAKRTRMRKKVVLDIMKERLLELQNEAVRLQEGLDETSTANILLRMNVAESINNGDMRSLEKQLDAAFPTDGNLIDQLRTTVRAETSDLKKGQTTNQISSSSTSNIRIDLEEISLSKCTKINWEECKVFLADGTERVLSPDDMNELRKEKNRIHAKLTRSRKKLFIAKLRQLILAMERQNATNRTRLEDVTARQRAVNSTSAFPTSDITTSLTRAPPIAAQGQAQNVVCGQMHQSQNELGEQMHQASNVCGKVHNMGAAEFFPANQQIFASRRIQGGFPVNMTAHADMNFFPTPGPHQYVTPMSPFSIPSQQQQFQMSFMKPEGLAGSGGHFFQRLPSQDIDPTIQRQFFGQDAIFQRGVPLAAISESHKRGQSFSNDDASTLHLAPKFRGSAVGENPSTSMIQRIPMYDSGHHTTYEKVDYEYFDYGGGGGNSSSGSADMGLPYHRHGGAYSQVQPHYMQDGMVLLTSEGSLLRVPKPLQLHPFPVDPRIIATRADRYDNDNNLIFNADYPMNGPPPQLDAPRKKDSQTNSSL